MRVFLFVFTVVVITSCSSKKHIVKDYEIIDSFIENNDSIYKRVITIDNKDIVSDITITPIDPSKPIIFIPNDRGGFIADNAVVNKKDIKKNEIIKEEEEVEVNDNKSHTTASKTHEEKDKKTDVLSIKHLIPLIIGSIIFFCIFVFIKRRFFI